MTPEQQHELQELVKLLAHYQSRLRLRLLHQRPGFEAWVRADAVAVARAADRCRVAFDIASRVSHD